MMKEHAAALCRSFLWCLWVTLFPVLSGILTSVLSLDPIETLFLQGAFMLLSLVLPLLLVAAKKWSRAEIGLGPPKADGFRQALYFLPVLVLFLPVAVKGFAFPSAAYVCGNLFLYLMVGISEELYFRGVIPGILSKAFSLRGTILAAAVVFALGHIASAFTASSPEEVLLTVFNAFLFGLLAMEMTALCGTLVPAILVHFLFDFETKITALPPEELFPAEMIRGAILTALVLWLAALLVKGKQRA